MSHTSTMKLQLDDISALAKACAALGLSMVENQKIKFYSGSATGTSIQLPGWKYPIVITPEGKIQYDNYNGNWGKIDELNKLLQKYNYEVVTDALSLEDFIYDETEEDGEIIIRTIN